MGINTNATLLFTVGFVILCLVKKIHRCHLAKHNNCDHLCRFVLSVNYHYCFRWFTQDAACMVFGAVTGRSSIRRIGSLLRAALGAEISVSMLTSRGWYCHGLRPRGVPWRPACSSLQLHRGVLQPTVGWSPGPPHTGLHSIILAPTVP